MKQEEINEVIFQLEHSAGKLLPFLFGKIGLNMPENRRTFLTKEWNRIVGLFQCFIVCIDESLEKEDPKIIEIIKSLYESRNSNLEAKEKMLE